MPRTRSSVSFDDSRINLVPTNGDRANYGNALEILDSGYLQSAGPSNIGKITQKPGNSENCSKNGTTTLNFTANIKIASTEIDRNETHDGTNYTLKQGSQTVLENGAFFGTDVDARTDYTEKDDLWRENTNHTLYTIADAASTQGGCSGGLQIPHNDHGKMSDGSQKSKNRRNKNNPETV